MALEACGIDYLLSFCTVGSMKKNILPGSFVIPHDFIDFTHRKTTFFDTRVVHVDMSEPFCPLLEGILQDVLKESEETFFSGIYVATEGPRLETPSEINMFSRFGDIVGMTLIPEAILAREKGLCYASLCLVSNLCAGLQASLPACEIIDIYKVKKNTIQNLLLSIIDSLPQQKTCSCSMIVQDGSI
jgi:5'-methylthioadenosine phosphorylase